MELRHLRYFKILSEELNFTRAAERLNISQPPLTRQIHDLENELGVTLFSRGYHKLELTREGETLLIYADKILKLADEATEKVANGAGKTRGANASKMPARSDAGDDKNSHVAKGGAK